MHTWMRKSVGARLNGYNLLRVRVLIAAMLYITVRIQVQGGHYREIVVVLPHTCVQQVESG